MAVFERLEAENASLMQQINAYKPKAESWERHEVKVAAEIDEKGRKLPAHFLPAFSLAQNLEQKSAIIAAAEAGAAAVAPAPPPQQPAPQAPPGGAPPGSPPPTQSADLRNMTEADLENLRRTNPDAFNKLLKIGDHAPAKAPGLFGMFGKK